MTATIGRLAPSPTGAQHLGNARTYLLAYLAARRAGGRLILRMEDVDSPRIKANADQQAIADLRWLGFDWDEGPDIGGPHAPYVQSHRLPYYRGLLDELRQRELVYPCTCSRKDVREAASAPHEEGGEPIYPGVCAHRQAADAELEMQGKPYCWRFRTNGVAVVFHDLVAGEQSATLAEVGGDFPVWKNDGGPAYQLAVVGDDHAMGVTQVVRGADLIPSTFRQLALYQAFGWTPPTFAHVPLVVGQDGRRLAKRHGDTRIAEFRRQGVPAERIIGYLAWSAGLTQEPGLAASQNLIDGFSWDHLSRSAFVVPAKPFG